MRLLHNAAMRRRLAILVLGGAVLATSPALADNSEAGKAFDEGRKLRDQRDFEKAANAFERSIAAEPSIGAYYNLAFSYEQLGRTRDALDAYRTARRLAKDKGDPREKEATEAVTKLLETHNYVTVIVPDTVDKTANVRVTVDGEAVAPNKLAGEVFRSAVEHEVVIAAPGRRERRIKVANRQPVTLTLGDADETITPAPPPADASSGGWGWQKWTGVGLFGAGVVGVTVSLVWVFSYESDASRLADARDKIAETCVKNAGQILGCPDRSAMSPQWRNFVTANDAYDSNERNARKVAPLFVGVGAVGVLLIGGGLYLFATAPSASRAEQTSPSHAVRMRVVPQVGSRDNGLAVVGTF